jgi:hypothetical protein
MKILCAVYGCELHAEWGYHQVQRETWGTKLDGWADLRFFVGRGNRELQPDEIRLDVPDDKQALQHKIPAMLQWALDHGYDGILKIDTDTYINMNLMRKENYERVDYAGAWVGDLGQRYASTAAYGFVQGSASWVSAEAAKIIARDMVAYVDKNVDYHFANANGQISAERQSEDLWCGQVLTPYLSTLRTHRDQRYQGGPLTFHCPSVVKYKMVDWMRAIHAEYPDAERMYLVDRRWRRMK